MGEAPFAFVGILIEHRVQRLKGDQPQHLRFDLGGFAIDEYRPIKVICVGAGFTGILAGIRCACVSLAK